METVGLFAVWDDALDDGLLMDVLVDSEGCFPVDSGFVVLFLAASFSSSEEISTTMWADILKGRTVAEGLAILTSVVLTSCRTTKVE